MKIGINIRYLERDVFTGIENYILNLVLNLNAVDKENEYVLFCGDKKKLPGEFLALNKNFRLHVSKFPTSSRVLRLIWDNVYLMYAILKERIDVFHAPFVAPMLKVCPTVLTVHDLAYLYFPDSYTYTYKLFLKVFLTRSIKIADKIIAVSNNTKSDVVKHFGVPESKIEVIYESADVFFKVDKSKVHEVREKYGINKDFILGLGLISPRKNFSTLLKAFKKLLHKGVDVQLVIVGGKGWLYNQVLKLVSDLNIGSKVVFTGYVPKEDLLYLYNCAKMFVYPSLYEGFGIPILEAMACGCPVIASNTSSIPEVCGDAAILVNPLDVDEICERMLTLLKDVSLRESLIERGLRQASKFSWIKTAERTMELYKNVYRENKSFI